MGVHQKIDRVARRSMKPYIPKDASFPHITDILHFEGKHGPDGIKTKSPGVDEPWHFIKPERPHDSELISQLKDHYANLVTALNSDDMVRAAFEASWLSHGITDGLTPAHHVAYEEAISQMRHGQHHMTRNSKIKKAVMPGKTKKELVKNNWQYWGAGGLMNKHLQFEFGVASAAAAMKFDSSSFQPNAEHGWKNVESHFLRSLAAVDALNMYDSFMKKGWTAIDARKTRDILLPEIIRCVMNAWCIALNEAHKR